MTLTISNRSLAEILRKVFIIGSNLNGRIDGAKFISALSGNEKRNYSLFWRFASSCSNTLLSIMAQLGHCDGDQELLAIIEEIIGLREACNHEEEDAGGHIAGFLRRMRLDRGERGID
ncbi:uncharacterized protein LOC113562383 [Ooceraea biroi]|uniref:uncharacterized protein LOC113562383 n=1 Tax=Ooceraea biroi TaxID=2015173 RepID=UPI000F08C496|nr:uncharacterized protein LOC113562383 [Ooceraea biroi]